MIDEEKTFEEFGYTSDSLTPKSHKKFNKRYGNCNNTKEQYIEFMEE